MTLLHKCSTDGRLSCSNGWRKSRRYWKAKTWKVKYVLIVATLQRLLDQFLLIITKTIIIIIITIIITIVTIIIIIVVEITIDDDDEDTCIEITIILLISNLAVVTITIATTDKLIIASLSVIIILIMCTRVMTLMRSVPRKATTMTMMKHVPQIIM